MTIRFIDPSQDVPATDLPSISDLRGRESVLVTASEAIAKGDVVLVAMTDTEDVKSGFVTPAADGSDRFAGIAVSAADIGESCIVVVKGRVAFTGVTASTVAVFDINAGTVIDAPSPRLADQIEVGVGVDGTEIDLH